MIIDSTHQSQKPRISANQLAEYIFSTPSKKVRILRDQKYGNIITSPYYQPALEAILGAFEDGEFDSGQILTARNDIEKREAKSKHQAKRWENNGAVLRCFTNIAADACPPHGVHTVVRRNAKIELDGVTVSVRPEIVTQQESGLFSYTKLRFSKSKVSEDASEIVLLLLLKHGQLQSVGGKQIDPTHTKLIDCFAKTIVEGHSIPRLRERQLAEALSEIANLWPKVPPPRNSRGDLPLAG
jgi:hypothetical protein